MKLALPFHPKPVTQRNRLAAFTMIEIAISLGVIGFALVAIIGILPYGLNVQKDNREETIINQDSAYFMEAIRGGAQGFDNLTNYVDLVTLTTYTNASVITANCTFGNGFVSGSNIVGLLSYPKYLGNSTNYVTAQVRALSGSALEQGQQNKLVAFHYQISSEIIPFGASTTPLTNLFEVRLNFQWPLINGALPQKHNQMLVRGMVSGIHISDETNGLYFFHPQTY